MYVVYWYAQTSITAKIENLMALYYARIKIKIE